MPDRRKEIANELDRLIKNGEIIWLSELIRAKPGPERKKLEEQLQQAEKIARKATRTQKGKSERSKPSKEAGAKAQAENKTQSILKEVQENDFGPSYQHWYSEALSVVEQLLPDRYEEFRELFRLDKDPKELTVTTYTIKNYVHGTRVTRMYGEEDVFNATSVAMTKFKDQIDILASAESRLGSVLADIEGTLEATLLDDELETASALLKAKHLRSAGIVAGVVLERHLKTVLGNHQVTLRKKAQIGNLNDALKEAKVLDVPRWREIQRLGDIRNLCGHDGEREPTTEEVRELIAGTEKVVATTF
jgi:hypothetical protein